VFHVFNYEPHYDNTIGMEIKFHAFLTPSLDTDEWTTSDPGLLTSGGRTPGTQRTGDWVGPTDSLDILENKDRLLLQGNEPWAIQSID